MKLTIEKSIYGGAGLARHEGKAIFVPFTLPGETVEASILHNKPAYAQAQLTQILTPSPHRVPPFCSHYNQCGGCHYQHAACEEQVRIKIAILLESLQRAHIADIPAIEPITAAPFGYRNRIRLHVQPAPFALGYLRAQSHTVLPIRECPIAAPSLIRAAMLLQSECATQLASWVREIELFTDPSTGALLISVYAPAGTTHLPRKLNELWRMLQPLLPQAAGCAAFALPRGKGFPTLAVRAGADHLVYTVAGEPYQVSSGSFFQINHFLLERMVAEVCQNRSGNLAWDLFAGVGLFARQLAHTFNHVVAAEAAPASVTDLRTNLPGHAIEPKTTLQFLREAANDSSFATPDYIVLDPPRAGLGTEAANLLANLRAPQVTYVSCDPATLSRDLAALLKSGYRLRKLALIDLFPQTFHLESIAHLSLAW
ncbi:MAG: 23S rRNA (uracil(1939)-C(5))-methyltransferase RlmD [Acidobacteriaceae bacterium]